MKSSLLRWLPVIAWAALIFSLSAVPEPLDAVPSQFSLALQNMRFFGIGMIALLSFIIHFFLYLMLGFLATRAFVGDQVLYYKPFLIAFTVSSLYALSDEFHQIFVQGRGFEFIDLLADGLGILAGLFFFSKWHAREKAHS